MLKNYFKITLRNAFKNKYYFVINVLGLSLSLFCCILIMIWIQDELSFDRFNVNSNNLYRVVKEASFEGEKSISAVTPPPLVNKIQNDLPEITNSSRFYHMNVPIKCGDRILEESKLSFADPAFLEMFTLNFVKGNSKAAFNEPYSIIITEKIAAQLFGNYDPIGKLLEIDNKYSLKITAVIKDMPGNSSLQFSMLAPFGLLKQSGVPMDDWRYNEFITFVMLKPDASFQSVEKKINGIMRSQFPEQKDEYILQPLPDIHLYSSGIKYDPMKHGEIKYVNILIVAGFLMLVISCINFINLTTASSFTRFKEIGVRKLMGAVQTDLVFQFTCESVFMFLSSLLIAIVSVQLILPSYNDFVGKKLSFFSYNNLPVFIVLIGVTFISCLVSSNYPAKTLSKYQRSVISHFKGKQSSPGLSYRKILVVGQFVFGTFFIVAMITINRQNNFLQTKKLGFEKEHLIYLPFQIRKDSQSRYNLIKNELLKNPNVKGVTTANNILTGLYSGSSNIKWEGQSPDEKASVFLCTAGFDFVETMGMKMFEGRSFSPEYAADLQRSVILNRKAVKAMNLKSPVGKNISFFGNRTVVGVVEDFHFKSLYQEVEPIMMLVDPACRYIFIRVNSNDVSSTINFIESTWKKELPDRPFSFNFLEETINNQYKSEQQLGEIINYFALFAIFISSLGLFGLVFFMAEKRNKEIGIRKVLGASVSSIVLMLTKDFTKWILIANLIALPLAYYAMNKWLQDFAYRIDLELWYFISAAAVALFITWATVAVQAVKAALTNPVESLKYE